ncbi:hypothetical protein MNEG_3951, partial [Monoraphidium neglectum]
MEQHPASVLLALDASALLGAHSQLLDDDVDRDMMRCAMAEAALAGGGAAAGVRAHMLDLRTGDLGAALAHVKEGPLTSRSVAHAATCPTDNIFDLLSDAAARARCPLDLVAAHGAGAAPVLVEPRRAAHIEGFMFDAAEHLAGAAGSKRLIVVSHLPSTPGDVALFLAPPGAAPDWEAPEEDVATLSAGGAAARQLARARLARLARLCGVSSMEGIAVWWLLLGGPPGSDSPAGQALWLELLRLL